MLPRWQRVLPLAIAILGVAHAADPDAGNALYRTCSACHGANGDGNLALNSPALAGQSAAYVARQLKFFKTGVRGATAGDTFGAQMIPVATTLANDAAVENMAAYLASLPGTKPAATVEGDAVAGNKQYQSKCGACHGVRGQGNDALNSPKLTGIGDAYLVRQVKAFQQGMRGSHADDTFGKQMKMMSVLVSDKELNDIVAFLNDKTEQE
ncbi:MAG: c-type cytochrome [Gammaproteobacteria bacterium]